MGILTKDQILAAEDLKKETIYIPEWGGDVILRSMKAIERDRFEDSMFEGKGKNRHENFRNLRARFLSEVLIDDNDKRLFPTPKDIEDLGQKSAGVLDRLFSIGRKLNGMTDTDVEEITKNSSEGQDEDLPLD